jgi:23S rRNA G2445 N2-methylase RlmL
MKYYITTLPGIENIAKQELVKKFKGLRINNIVRAKNNTLVFFNYKGNGLELLQIKTAEDLYADLGGIKLGLNKKDLVTLDRYTKSLSVLETGLHLHRQIYNKKSKKTTFRVVAQASSDYKAYRRVDAQKVVERSIANKYNKKWKIVDDDSQLEFWLHLIKNKAYLGLRLSDKRMRHRTYKIEHLPASLRPTVAYALVWLSDIQDDDIFLDPMCGAGTILIERSQAGRYKQLIGGDINKKTVELAKKNIGRKYKPILIELQDAQKLSLSDNSVNKVVSNLPWGKQIGSHQENKVLYDKFLKEVIRVLKSRGKAVFLTSESKIMINILQKQTNFRLINTYKNIFVLGQRADIFIIKKI